MIEKKEKQIDDLKVLVVQFGARRGLKLKIKLLKMFGAPLLQMINGLGLKTSEINTEIKSIMEQDVDLGGLAEGLNSLFSKVNEDQAEQLIMEILSSTFINDQECTKVFDEVFSGDYLTMYKVIGFALEANFGSFFGKSGIGTLTK